LESWFAPAAVAEPLPRQRTTRRSAAAPARPKAQRRRGRSFRVRLPLVWMAVFAVLLVGVVAVNVAVLRANVSVNDLDKQIAQRTAYLQTVRASSLAARASGESNMVATVPAVRGTIFDRMGTPLAIAEAATDVVADPMQIADPVHTARVVSRVLGVRLRPLIR